MAAELRHAIQLLYQPSNRNEQHRADTWLQEFRTTAESWLLCLELLSNPNAQEPEAYFAANTLRYNCSKSAVVITADVAAQLFPKLVLCLFDALAKSKWTVASQLSTALAVLILRTASWSPHSIIQDLEKLLLTQLTLYQQLQQQQGSAIAHVAMLQVLAALPPACADKHCNVHPNRRNMVSEALAASPHIQPWIQAAFLAYEQQQPSQGKQLYLNLGMQLIHGWCELGCMPIMLPQQLTIVQHVCVAAFNAETAGIAGEAMVSMLTVCKDVQAQGSELLLLLVQCWHEAMTSLQTPVMGHDVLQAMCSVLCAAASALLPFSLGADASMLKSHFLRVAEQLMVHLTSADNDVALTALEFWQDTYITTLQGLPTSVRQAAIATHTSLLQSLTTGLVLRSQLDGSTAASATADARDLPDDVRMVRRELSSALRDVTSLVGLSSMSQYLAALVQAQYTQYTEGNGTGVRQSWTALECALYAANVVLGQQGPGRRREMANTTAVQRLVEIAVACIRLSQDPTASPKLLGTALTLIGGLSTWYLEQPDALRAVLPALSIALQSSNEKLARNAATTIYRLSQHTSLAAIILTRHQAWVESVLQLYHSAGGVQKRIGTGSDLPTEELLLATLCRLAMQPTAESLPYGANLLQHLAEPKLQELRQAVSGLVGCAPVALQMLAGSGSDSNRMGSQSGAAPSALQQACQVLTVQAQQRRQAMQQVQQQPQPQVDAAMQSEVAQATTLASQAGACLEVLHMVAENATASGNKSNRDIAAMQSTGTSGAGSPDREHGGHGIGHHYSRTNSFSEVSRTSGSSINGALQQHQPLDSACSEHVLNLVRNVWSILQPYLGQLQPITIVMAPTCGLFTCALKNLPGSMQGDMLLLSIQLLSCFGPRSLVMPKSQALLVACLELHACGPRPASPAQQAAQQLQLQQARNATLSISRADSASTNGAFLAPQPQATLLSVTQSAVVHSCQQAVMTGDPDLIGPTLMLCSASVRWLPQVLALPATLDAMLGMTRGTARSYDVQLCTQWLEWVVQFMCAPYGGTRARAGQQSFSGTGLRSTGPKLQLGMVTETPPSRGQSSHGGASMQPEGITLLGQLLEGGAGPQLLLALLMAASGDMPPDLVQAIAVATHQLWGGVGSNRFSSWMEKAVLELAGEQAPWSRLKQDIKIKQLQELVSTDTEYDVGRFKKLLKAFCGGKKKAGFAGSLPGSRSVSRSSSTLSSMHISQ